MTRRGPYKHKDDVIQKITDNWYRRHNRKQVSLEEVEERLKQNDRKNKGI